MLLENILNLQYGLWNNLRSRSRVIRWRHITIFIHTSSNKKVDGRSHSAMLFFSSLNRRFLRPLRI